MPFDINTIPKIRLSEKLMGSAKIKKESNRFYFLYVNDRQQMMLDLYTNKEIKEQYSSYDLGYGKILMSGLGFGILALWLAQKKDVESIHIIEQSQDVVDIFLEKNILPNNITIEIADIEKYKTDQYFDCLLLDHYELHDSEYKVKSMQNIAKNIPNHKLFWSWSVECIYMDIMYNHKSDTIEDKDLSNKWEDFVKNVINIPTLPNIEKDKVNEYIGTYYGYETNKV